MKIAIVGGGVAGATAARYLSELGLEITLFEKNSSLMNGPPMCHLHAGGNLYREISDEQCMTLLEQSIDFVKYYQQAIDFRPTVLIVPQSDALKPEAQLSRLKKLKRHYQQLVEKNEGNGVLGGVEEYYRLYSEEKCRLLAQREPLEHPISDDEWMIPVVKSVALEKVQFPLIMVKEYGINLFRLAALLTHTLEEKFNCNLLLSHKVVKVERCEEGFSIFYEHEGRTRRETFQFLINAAGFQTGEIDDMLGFPRKRFVEFKAAYVTQWKRDASKWPEVIFHGERGTPRGMAQLTPYPGGVFQLHGMTHEITLFPKGLVQSSLKSAQPRLDALFYGKMEEGWQQSVVEERTQKAIEHVAHYIPSFATAKSTLKPLFGAQQIPGVDETLRTADVTFEGTNYARCEVVKANSVLTMVDTIVEKLVTEGFLEKSMLAERGNNREKVDEATLKKSATDLASCRYYPKSLGDRLISIKESA
jgi:glycine/D-amino acid oxidase-like deaminating enzyme